MEQAHESSVKHIQFLPINESRVVFELLGAEISYTYNGLITENGKKIVEFTLKNHLSQGQMEIIRALPLECYY